MKTNVGAFDGALRTLLFVVTIVFSIMTGQWWWLIPTAMIFATAVFYWCPIYAIFGIDTNKTGQGR